MLKQLQREIEDELAEILAYWMRNAPDPVNGGFVGKVDNQGMVYPEAAKGGVLNFRILWAFSAALNHYREFDAESDQSSLRNMAAKAFDYIKTCFFDHEKGGVYWSLNPDGTPADTRKQVYGLAFALYGCAEYYRAVRDEEALRLAIDLFYTIEKYSYDPEDEGYREAFTRQWEMLDDVKLSNKDRNDPKTMNTHLHLIEAYVNLYKVWKDEGLRSRIHYLLELTEDKILDKSTGHLRLFFDNTWKPQSEAVSFGHDIEASWLLFDAASALENTWLINKWRTISLQIAEASTGGFQDDGTLCHEFDPLSGHWDRHREWWVPAEAMVGYLNAYELSGDTLFLEYVDNQWDFIKNHLKDRQNGEWFWGVYPPEKQDGKFTLMENEDKIGFWKCPYHNTRACIEIIERIHRLNRFPKRAGVLVT